MYWPKCSSSEETNTLKALQNHTLRDLGSLACVFWYLELPVKILFSL